MNGKKTVNTTFPWSHPKSFPFNLGVMQKKLKNILTFTGFTKVLNALHCVMHIWQRIACRSTYR